MTHLVTVAHGTRNLNGNDVNRAVAAAAAARLGITATAAFVELSAPLFADVMVAATEPVVVVPMLLSTGYHVRVDLPEAVAKAPVSVRVGPTLGPDPLLADAQVERLLEAGATREQRVVLVAAGSSDEAATRDQLCAVARLSRAWGGRVELATLSGHGQRPAEIVQDSDAVSPYLLSPGFFHDRIRREVPPGAIVADVIGAHPLVVDLVVQRVRALAGRDASLAG